MKYFCEVKGQVKSNLYLLKTRGHLHKQGADSPWEYAFLEVYNTLLPLDQRDQFEKFKTAPSQEIRHMHTELGQVMT